MKSQRFVKSTEGKLRENKKENIFEINGKRLRFLCSIPGAIQRWAGGTGAYEEMTGRRLGA